MDEEKRLYLEQEIQEMMEAFERHSHEHVWSALFRELPESKDGIEAYPDLVHRTAALACLVERGTDRSESDYLKVKLSESVHEHFFSKLSNVSPSGEMRELVDQFYEGAATQPPGAMACFDSPLQATLAASWLLAAYEVDSPKTVYLPIVRVPEVLSLHTNGLLIRQPYFLRFEPESIFLLAVSLVRKRKDFEFLAKVEQAFRNANRLHGWLFQEMLSALDLHFEQGLIAVRPGGDTEDVLEHPLASEVLTKLQEAVPAELGEKLKRANLKVRHFAVAQRVGMRGRFDVGWTFFLKYLERRLPKCKILNLIDAMDLISSRDWWAFPDVAVVSMLPVICEHDVNGAPHREDGKAVEFSDGFGVYAVDGERAPAEEFESRVAASRERSILAVEQPEAEGTK